MSRVRSPREAAFALASLVVLCSCAGTKDGSGSSPAWRTGTGDPQEDRRLARAALASDPQSVDAWFRLALGWQADTTTAGHVDSARVAYESLLALDSESVEGLVHYGLVLEDLQRFDEAQAQYEKAIAIAPDDPLPHVNLGALLYFHFNRTYEAKAELARALELDPSNADAHFNLGVLFADANLFGEAQTEWEKVLETAPEGPARSLAEENLARIRPLLEPSP
jgi:Tfp pilus assembly protein PilF